MSSPLTEDLTFSPDDYDDNPDQEDEEGGSGQKKRKQVKRACFSCRKAHARCDEERPCRRCIRTGCEVTCVDVPRKKRVLKKPMKEEKLATGLKRGRRRRIDESGEGCESGGESDSKNFYFDVGGDDEVLEGGSVAGKTTPLSLSTAAANNKPTPSVLSASISSVRKFDFSSIAIDTPEDLKLSWKDSLLDSMTFAHNSDDAKSSSSSTSTTSSSSSTSSQSAASGEEEAEFCFDLGKSSDDERCLEEIPQEMVRELTELRSYNSTLQDMIKDVQQFNSYQRKKRRQWELSKLNGGAGAAASGLAGATTVAPGGATTTNGAAASGAVSLSAVTAAPSDALPQWLVSDFSSLSNKLVDLSADPHSSSAAPSSSTQAGGRGDDHQVGDLDYLGAWQQLQHASSSSSSSLSALANHGAPLQLPTQLALLAGQTHSMSQLLGGHHQQQQLQLPLQQQQQQQQAQTQQQQQQPPRPAPQNANSNSNNNEASGGPAPFTTSLPFTEV